MSDTGNKLTAILAAEFSVLGTPDAESLANIIIEQMPELFDKAGVDTPTTEHVDCMECLGSGTLTLCDSCKQPRNRNQLNDEDVCEECYNQPQGEIAIEVVMDDQAITLIENWNLETFLDPNLQCAQVGYALITEIQEKLTEWKNNCRPPWKEGS